MIKKIESSFSCCFLLCFMLLIFGPAEIFFSNVTEFQFIYREFAGYLAGGGIILTIIMALIGVAVPDYLRRIYLSIIFSIAVAGYFQIMFLNKQLDLLGINPDGYHVKLAQAVGNFIVWFLIIMTSVFFAFYKKELWEKIILDVSLFLLGVQIVAYISLVLTAKKEAFQYPESTWHLSGKEQFTVSTNENVIVIILDMFSNSYLDSLEESYPGTTDFLHDFTYYSNMDCTYMGTFPSLAHMLTGCELDMQISVNDWFAKIWEDEKVTNFYDMLHEKNYEVNLYTSLLHVLTGTNDIQILNDKFSNMSNDSQNRDIKYNLLYKTMFKMSAYRMLPEILKPYFYTNMTEYSDVVEVVEDKVCHNNFDFYGELLKQGLTLDEKHNYYIIQHLMGPHAFTTDEHGHYKENSTLDETTKGCMVIVEEYLEELKKAGVYDNSTIIITADHGISDKPQVIFYLKKVQEHHDDSPVDNSPVSHKEFFPTIVDAVGENYLQYGKTVYDFNVLSDRERTYWLYAFDEDYPIVPYFSGEQNGSCNVYYGYTYTGDSSALSEHITEGPDKIIPMIDSVY